MNLYCVDFTYDHIGRESFWALTDLEAIYNAVQLDLTEVPAPVCRTYSQYSLAEEFSLVVDDSHSFIENNETLRQLSLERVRGLTSVRRVRLSIRDGMMEEFENFIIRAHVEGEQDTWWQTPYWDLGLSTYFVEVSAKVTYHIQHGGDVFVLDTAEVDWMAPTQLSAAELIKFR